MLKESMLAHNHSMLQLGLTTFHDTITRTIYNWSKFIFKLHTHECSAGVSRSPLIWLHSATLLPGQPTKFWVCHKQEAQIHNYLYCPIQQGQGKDLVRGSGGRLACFWLFILGIVGAQVLRSLYSNTFPVSWGENGGLDMWWSLSDTCENNKGVFNSEKSVHTHAPTPKSTSRSGYRKPSQQKEWYYRWFFFPRGDSVWKPLPNKLEQNWISQHSSSLSHIHTFSSYNFYHDWCFAQFSCSSETVNTPVPWPPSGSPASCLVRSYAANTLILICHTSQHNQYYKHVHSCRGRSSLELDGVNTWGTVAYLHVSHPALSSNGTED